jgi:hypothetical protein
VKTVRLNSAFESKFQRWKTWPEYILDVFLKSTATTAASLLLHELQETTIRSTDLLKLVCESEHFLCRSYVDSTTTCPHEVPNFRTVISQSSFPSCIIFLLYLIPCEWPITSSDSLVDLRDCLQHSWNQNYTESEFFYDWRFTADQSVLVTRPMRLTTSIFNWILLS